MTASRLTNSTRSNPNPNALIELAAGDYAASISPIGASLVQLRYRGRPLVRDLPGTPPRPRFRGAVLAPWPNRIRDGRYRYAGQLHHLPLTEPDRGCALHGLLLWHTWTVHLRRAREALLVDTVWPQPGYPFAVEVAVGYVLDDVRGLRIMLTARNVGDAPAPFGASIHPYLVAGAGTVDDWTLTLPADAVIETDPKRLLPRRHIRVDNTDYDFRRGRTIGPTALDHAFGGVGFEPDGTATATVTAADGTGVRIGWDTTCRWVQVHTTDHREPDVHRSGLALEPMTCPPDAFNSGTDVWALEPGDERSVSWQISSVHAD